MLTQLLLAVVLTTEVANAPSGKFDAAAVAATPELAKRADTNFLAQRWDLATERYGQLTRLNPTNGLYWYRLGISCLESGKYDEAIGALSQSEKLGVFQWNPPRMAYRGESAWGLAAAHARAGHRDEAVRWTDIAIHQGLRDIRRFHGRHFQSLHDDPSYRKLVWLVDAKGLSREAGLRLDIRYLLHEAKRIHYAPFKQVGEAEIDSMAAALADECGSLTDDQVLVRLMRLVRQFGDGHTQIRRETRQPRLPVNFFLFPEGLHITSALEPHADLVGAKVVRIGDRSVDEVFQAAAEVASRDNEQTVKLFATHLLTSPTILRGLGVMSPEGPIAIEVVDALGKQRHVELSAIEKVADSAVWHRQVPGCQSPLPLSLTSLGKVYSMQLVSEQKLLYCQLNGIGTDNAKSLSDFCKQLFAEAEKPEVETLVIDLRYNGGGNTFMNQPLIDGILRSDKLNQPGKTFVIIGRTTFSAAQNTTSDLERRTKALLVGEPTGSCPNFIGESIAVPLPYSGLVLSPSDLWWQHSMAMDYRVWTPPHLYAPPTAAAYRAHRDLAMEAIAAYREQAVKKP